MKLKAKFEFRFKYDYIDFFISSIIFIVCSLLVYCIGYYIFHYPLVVIIDDIGPMIQRSVVIAAALNLYWNIKRIYDMLNYNVIKSKKINKEPKKLTKAYPKYSIRSISLNKAKVFPI